MPRSFAYGSTLVLLSSFLAPSIHGASVVPTADIQSKPFATVAYKPPSVRATLKPYKVAPTLANVGNLARFGRVFRFSADQKRLLSQNGFVVTPASEEQLFFIYENNDYLEMPSFVTSDSVLQVYHVFYDYTLRKVEQSKLIGELATLCHGLVDSSKAQLGASQKGEVHEAALKNLAYSTIALKLLEPGTAVDQSVADLVSRELKLIGDHNGRSPSPIFAQTGIEVDYSQFIPRGHYTRTPELQRYFMSMMWLGLMPFPLEDARSNESDTLSTRQALLLTAALFADPGGNKEPLITHWDRIYAPTAFYVGVADDLTPFDYRDVAREAFPNGLAPQSLEDTAAVERFVALGKNRFRTPGIAASIGDQVDGTVQRRQFRVMGQRFVLDSRILQELTFPKVGSESNRRLMPKGLDVMAALGSDRAARLVLADPVEKAFPNLESQMTKMRNEVASIDDATWTSNLYYSWLWTLQSLLTPAGEGYPSFMRTTAWEDKNLSTALSSWAELKHDTVLYGKQSGAECGSGEEPPVVKGYVEPNVELYARLKYLTSISRSGLLSRGLIEPEENVDSAFEQFDDLLTFLERVSEKELKGVEPTREEYDQIRYFGSQLEILTLSVIDEGLSGWFEIESETDRNMALITDVHSGGDKALQTGVGHAYNIFVVVPIGGKLQMTRGAVFSYYEFQHPASDRLTDEAWQALLKTRKAPPHPPWVTSFLSGAPVVAVRPKEIKYYSSGC